MAQDLAALLKRQLVMLCPLMRIFLDVDDLQSIGDLEHYIDQTACIVCVLSKGYFMSANSMREVMMSQLSHGGRSLLANPTPSPSPARTLSFHPAPI